MYTDPAQKRTHSQRIRLNDAEYAVVKAAAAKLGLQTATFARMAALDGLEELARRAGIDMPKGC